MIIGLEGNIGAGKSTLLRKLAQMYPEVVVVPEDIAAWNSYTVEDKPLLAAYYDEPPKHGFKTQMAILLSRHHANQRAAESPDRIFVHERTMIADVHIFGKLGVSQGSLTQTEYDIMRDWAHAVNREPDVTVFIDVDPKVCFDRMRNRGRSEEDGVSSELLHQLHDMHHQWYNDFDKLARIVRIQNNDEDAIEEIVAFLRNAGVPLRKSRSISHAPTTRTATV